MISRWAVDNKLINYKYINLNETVFYVLLSVVPKEIVNWMKYILLSYG